MEKTRHILAVNVGSTSTKVAFYRDAVQTAAAGGTPPTAGSPQFEHVRAQMAAFQPIQLLLGVVAMAVVSSGVYRAVLEPEKSAYGYLRLGRQELLVGMVVVVMYMLMVIAVVAVFVPLGIVAAVGQMGHPQMLAYDVVGRPAMLAAGLLQCGGITIDRATHEAVAAYVEACTVDSGGEVRGFQVTGLR